MPTHPHWQNRNVLVTGGSGFGGHHLIRHLLNAGANITSIDLSPPTDRSRDRHPPGSVEHITGDICYQNQLQRLLDDRRIDTVFHLAAQPLVPESLRDPANTWSINLDGTLALLEAMRRSRNTRRLVFASSGAIYGNLSSPDPIREHDTPGSATHAYAASKIAAEAAVESHSLAYGLHSVRCRFMNTYGPGDRHLDRLIPGALHRLENNLPYDFGDRDDGSTELDFLHVDDMSRAYLAAGEKIDQPEVDGNAINFGSADPVAISQVVRTLSRTYDGEDRTPIFHGQKQAFPRRKSLDISRARDLLHWQPQIDLERGLTMTVSYKLSKPLTTITSFKSPCSSNSHQPMT